MCFYANLGASFFEVKQRWAMFYPDFPGFYPDFQQIKTFGGALASPSAAPASLNMHVVSKNFAKTLVCVVNV